jgi:hypothetical protein
VTGGATIYFAVRSREFRKFPSQRPFRPLCDHVLLRFPPQGSRAVATEWEHRS